MSMGIGGKGRTGGESGGQSGGASSFAELNEFDGVFPLPYDRVAYDSKTDSWATLSSIKRSPTDLIGSNDTAIWFDCSSAYQTEDSDGNLLKLTDRLNPSNPVILEQPDASRRFPRTGSDEIATTTSQIGPFISGPRPFTRTERNDNPPVGPEYSLSGSSNFIVEVSVLNGRVEVFGNEIQERALETGFRLSRVLVNGVPIEDNPDYYISGFRDELGFDVMPQNFGGDGFDVEVFFYDDQPEEQVYITDLRTGAYSDFTMIVRADVNPGSTQGFCPLISIGGNDYISLGTKDDLLAVKAGSDIVMTDFDPTHTSEQAIALRFSDTNLTIYCADMRGSVDQTFSEIHFESNFGASAGDGKFEIGSYPGSDQSGIAHYHGLFDFILLETAPSEADIKSLFRYLKESG